MAYVVTGRCVDCRYMDCVDVCPVDCFYEVKEPAMLVIDPDQCIDCDMCVPACPVNAIFSEDDLPEAYAGWLEKNEELSMSEGAEQKDSSMTLEPLPTAIDFDEIKKRETEAGIDAGD